MVVGMFWLVVVGDGFILGAGRFILGAGGCW